jgi:cytolysin (calcineurin-like family phosphatase)
VGGFALVRITDAFVDVVLGEASGPHGEVTFTNAFSKPLG